MVELLLSFVTVPLLLLLVQLLKETDLSVELVNSTISLFYHVFEGIDLLPVEVLHLVTQLFQLLPQDSILFYFVFKLLFCQLATLLRLPLLFILWTHLHLLESLVELFIK